LELKDLALENTVNFDQLCCTVIIVKSVFHLAYLRFHLLPGYSTCLSPHPSDFNLQQQQQQWITATADMAIWTWVQLVRCTCYGTYELQRNITLPFLSLPVAAVLRRVSTKPQPIIHAHAGTRRSKIPVSSLGNGTYPLTSSSSSLSSPSSSFLSDTNTSARISAASTGASHWRCPAGRDAIRVW
jgi:hypothetical protein